jgi:GT2 family glycosyltransferase
MGFSSGNNIGVAHADKNSDYILFLNPDVFIDNKLLENIFKKMESKEFSDVGISSPVLHGFSNALFQPTLLVDSAGIKKTWYGRYYDFYQGKKVQDFEELNKSEFESLICGAFMFCRKKALIKRIENSSVWDESFFMYKEDIELSLYIKSLGWRSIIFTELAAFHCRGWSKSRSNMSEFSIRESIKSDWILFRKNKLFLNFKIIDFFYLILKTLFVGMEIGYRRLKKIKSLGEKI